MQASISSVFSNPVVKQSIENACSALKLEKPHEHLIELPQADKSVSSVTSVSALLFEKIGNDYTILMVRQRFKKGESSFPGGYRSGAPEDKHGKPTPETIAHEQYFPLLTASRELFEEIGFLFNTPKDAYVALNHADTKIVKNSGWNHFPVLIYVRHLSKEQSEKVSQALEGKLPVENEEVVGISRVAFKALQAAFSEHKWTKDGLNERARLINQAKVEKKTADLSQFAQYDQKVTLKDTLGGSVEISPYTARTIFHSLDEIEAIAIKS